MRTRAQYLSNAQLHIKVEFFYYLLLLSLCACWWVNARNVKRGAITGSLIARHVLGVYLHLYRESVPDCAANIYSLRANIGKYTHSLCALSPRVELAGSKST